MLDMVNVHVSRTLPAFRKFLTPPLRNVAINLVSDAKISMKMFKQHIALLC